MWIKYFQHRTLGFQEYRYFSIRTFDSLKRVNFISRINRVIKLMYFKNYKRKSRFRVVFFRFSANRWQTVKSTYEKSPYHFRIRFFFCSFIMRAQTQTGSKARSINIRERSVARRRREQMNNILIDRPEKKLNSHEGFFLSLVCIVDSRIFFYADRN